MELIKYLIEKQNIIIKNFQFIIKIKNINVIKKVIK